MEVKPLDEKDYKIVELLRRDARTTNSAIAKQVDLTEGAVRNRIGRLVRSDVIRRFTIETGPTYRSYSSSKDAYKGQQGYSEENKEIC